MSDSVAFALIVGTFIFGTFLSFYLSRVADEKGNDIASGVSHGAFLPMRHRWVVLYTDFVTWALGSVTVSVFVVLASLLIARNVAGADPKLLAYLAAFLHACSILTWATMGPLHVIHYRSILRQAEAGN
ncbi:hypothetical protein N9917_01800 [Deltaproteobacteria bacterium]|nr:hypothetical protein [Deltaproteobacteria bacterium]